MKNLLKLFVGVAIAFFVLSPYTNAQKLSLSNNAKIINNGIKKSAEYTYELHGYLININSEVNVSFDSSEDLYFISQTKYFRYDISTGSINAASNEENTKFFFNLVEAAVLPAGDITSGYLEFEILDYLENDAEEKLFPVSITGMVNVTSFSDNSIPEITSASYTAFAFINDANIEAKVAAKSFYNKEVRYEK